MLRFEVSDYSVYRKKKVRHLKSRKRNILIFENFGTGIYEIYVTGCVAKMQMLIMMLQFCIPC